jgi:hypothetical protein
MVGLHQHAKLAAKKIVRKSLTTEKNIQYHPGYHLVYRSVYRPVSCIIQQPVGRPTRLPQLGRNWAPQTPEILWHQGLRCILSQAVDILCTSTLFRFENWVYPHKVGYWDRKKWWLGNECRATLFSDKATYPWLVQWWFNHQKLSMGAKWDIPSGKLTVCYW